MSRIQQPLERHIHDDLCSEVNDTIINCKIHHLPLSEMSAEQQAKIIEARKMKHSPTWKEIIELLSRVRDEMNSCTMPFKKNIESW